MNILNIPFHHWRKIEKEGVRTRDAHIIEKLSKKEGIEKLIILNRPISLVEIILKRFSLRLNGKILLKKRNFFLYEISEKTFVIDHVSLDLLGPIFLKKKWFFKSYANRDFFLFFEECCEFLRVENMSIITHTIYSVGFVSKIKNSNILFDAYDNLTLFPGSKSLKNEILKGYEEMSILAKVWTSNSQKNVDFYLTNFQPKKLVLIKNGVDLDTFRGQCECPKELRNIKGPIIGFGGKINHLFDVELFNYLTSKNSDKNFVILGQIMDYKVFKKIIKRNNVYYFGDKKYSDYCSFVRNFDVGIIPYKIDPGTEHGGDSIKAYEYIAAGKRVIGTNGNGIPELSDYLKVAMSYEEFNDILMNFENMSSPKKMPEIHSWSSKANQYLEWV
jgi:glycosyltransferase involved in cell wall biosynthesis